MMHGHFKWCAVLSVKRGDCKTLEKWWHQNHVRSCGLADMLLNALKKLQRKEMMWFRKGGDVIVRADRAQHTLFVCFFSLPCSFFTMCFVSVAPKSMIYLKSQKRLTGVNIIWNRLALSNYYWIISSGSYYILGAKLHFVHLPIPHLQRKD